jgi:IS30 family transposase
MLHGEVLQASVFGRAGLVADAIGDGLAAKPRLERKLVPGSPLFDQVVGHLRHGLSPEQIAFTLGHMPHPVRLSHETIYTALYAIPRGQLRAHILNRFHAQMRRSMTYDQGTEMARHQNLSERTGLKVYFAHPHSPWERGINENTNGLLRQYLPKAEDLSVYSQEQLDDIAEMLNARPRKSLGWKAPAQLFLPEGTFDFQKFWSAKINNVALGT